MDPFLLHELLHTSFIISEMFESQIKTHIGTELLPQPIQCKIAKIESELYQLYQDLGHLNAETL